MRLAQVSGLVNTEPDTARRPSPETSHGVRASARRPQSRLDDRIRRPFPGYRAPGSGTDRFDPSPWSVRITAVLLAVVAVLLVISMIE